MHSVHKTLAGNERGPTVFLVSQPLSVCRESNVFIMPFQFKSLLLLTPARLSSYSAPTPASKQKGSPVWRGLCVEMSLRLLAYPILLGLCCCPLKGKEGWGLGGVGCCKIDHGLDIPVATTLSDGNGASILMGSCLALPQGAIGWLPASGRTVCFLLQV